MSEIIVPLLIAIVAPTLAHEYNEHRRRRNIRVTLAIEASGTHGAFEQIASCSFASFRVLQQGDKSSVRAAIATLTEAYSGFVINGCDTRIDSNALSKDEVKYYRLLLDRWNRFMAHETRYAVAIQAALDKLAAEDPSAIPSAIAMEHLVRARGSARILTAIAYDALNRCIDLVSVLNERQNAIGFSNIGELTGGLWPKLPEKVEGPPHLGPGVRVDAADSPESPDQDVTDSVSKDASRKRT